jgi:pyruvyl transferase EpsO
MMTMSERARVLRAQVESCVGRVIGGRPVTAMVDFPNYPNVGDSAIYLGQLACLRSLGISRPGFICDLRSYDRNALIDAAGDGVILLTGGGNFGDLWPAVQEAREDIMGHCLANPIVQLPQTVRFESPPHLERARAAIEKHGDVTILCRDAASLDIVRGDLGARGDLCPDMAFCLDELNASPSRRDGIVWLARNDKEASHAAIEDECVEIADWDSECETRLFRRNKALTEALIRRPRQRRRALLSRRAWRELLPRTAWRSLAMATYEPLARERLDRGIELLSRGGKVITDRLHGHILSTLLGIPHVILDNSYGKLSSFYRQWTHDTDGIVFAEDSREALEMAREL